MDETPQSDFPATPKHLLYLAQKGILDLRAYERGLEDASVVARALRPWVQFAQFQWLRDGGEKALVGREGWLFYKPGYDDTLAQFSNYGAVVDVCAPGVDIYSTYPVSMGGYTTMSGTSMASPEIAPEWSAQLMPSPIMLRKPAAWPVTMTLPLPLIFLE